MIDGAASLFPALLILVAAWTLGSIFEQFMHDILFSHNRKGLPPGVQIAAFGQGNDMICPASEFLRFGPGCPDSIMLKQGCHHISEHGIAVTRGSI